MARGTTTDFSAMRCSIARTFGVLSDPWCALILRDLHVGVDRFDDLVADLGISRKVLSERLRRLVDEGIAERVPYHSAPVRHRYRLTAAGDELVPPLLTLLAWGDRWRPTPDGPPILIRHDDHVCEPVVTCRTCEGEIAAPDVTALPGPGGRVGPGTRLIGSVAAGPHG